MVLEIGDIEAMWSCCICHQSHSIPLKEPPPLRCPTCSASIPGPERVALERGWLALQAAMNRAREQEELVERVAVRVVKLLEEKSGG